MSRPFNIKSFEDESQIRALRNNNQLVWDELNKYKTILNKLNYYYDEEIKISDLRKIIRQSVKEFITRNSNTIFSLDPDSEITLCSAALGDMTISLPVITNDILYNRYTIKKTDTTTNTITLSGNVDGGSYVLHHPYEAVVIVAGSGGYSIVSHYIGSGIELFNDPDSVFP